jgi:hypothetical protein
MVDAVADAVALGNRLVEPAEDGLSQMAVLDAIRDEAARSSPRA